MRHLRRTNSDPVPISPARREWIDGQLRRGVDPLEIVRVWTERRAQSYTGETAERRAMKSAELARQVATRVEATTRNPRNTDPKNVRTKKRPNCEKETDR